MHEDEAEEHSKAMNAVPVHGFYRVWTREQDLGLLFVTLVAFARTEAYCPCRRPAAVRMTPAAIRMNPAAREEFVFFMLRLSVRSSRG